jgi:hypothetical protein
MGEDKEILLNPRAPERMLEEPLFMVKKRLYLSIVHPSSTAF